MPDKVNAAEIWCQLTKKTEKANEKLLLLLVYADSIRQQQ